MKKISFLVTHLIMFLLLSASIPAQEIVTLKDGRNIVIYPNGTWVEYNQPVNPGETIDYDAVLKEQRQKELEAQRIQKEIDKEEREKLRQQEKLQKLAEKKARLEQKINQNLGEGDTLPEPEEIVFVDDADTKKQAPPVVQPPVEVVNLNCKFAVNEQDAFTGTVKKLTKAEYLLSYSPPGFKESNGGTDKISIGGYLGSMDNARIFYFNMQIKSTDAYKQYGDIEYRGKLLLKLANGNLVELRAGKEAQANINIASEITSYSTYYLLNEKNFKNLQKSPITNIRVVWSKGYDDFEVTNQSFFVENLACIQ